MAKRDRVTCPLARSKSDPAAFGVFYDAYSERVLRFMTKRVLDAEVALDLTADTFAYALEKRMQFRGTTEGEEGAWLFSIARTQLSGYWRRGRSERDALARIGVETPAMTDAELERLEDLAQVQSVVRRLGAAVSELPDDQRRAVQLRVVDELSYAAVAEQEGVADDVARSRVSRGLRALASSLQDQGVFAEDLA